MDTLRIAVGTTSKKKIGYLKTVLRKLKVNAELFPQKVSSGISDQPLTSDETKTGSINRADNALKSYPSADIGIGIEAGSHKNEDGKYEMFCWTTIIDKNGNKYFAQSDSLILTNYFQDLLNKGEFLGNYRHENKKLKDDNDYPHKYLAKILEYRRPLIVNSIEKALIYYLCQDEF